MMIYFLFLIAGLAACIPLARLISPPPVQLMIILFAPWMILFFLNQHTWMSYYLTFVIGMCLYWTYFEIKKALKKNP